MKPEVSKILEVNNFLIVWHNLRRLSGKSLKIKQVNKIAKILSREHLCQRDKTIFTLAGRFESSVSFSKNRIYFFRVSMTSISKQEGSTLKKIFSLCKNEFKLSLDAAELIVNMFFRLSPYVAFGIDGDMPRLKLYSQLEFHRINGTTNDDIIKSILELADILSININKDYMSLIFGEKTVFNSICVDFYTNKKYAIKVYLQLSADDSQKELTIPIHRFGISEDLISKAKQRLLCYAFSKKYKNMATETLFLKFNQYPTDFNFSAIYKSLGYKGGEALRKFIDANKIVSMPIVSFLAFGKDKFTVYMHPGLNYFPSQARGLVKI